jgi:uncharacterized alpha-E superfamily protein
MDCEITLDYYFFLVATHGRASLQGKKIRDYLRCLHPRNPRSITAQQKNS